MKERYWIEISNKIVAHATVTVYFNFGTSGNPFLLYDFSAVPFVSVGSDLGLFDSIQFDWMMRINRS